MPTPEKLIPLQELLAQEFPERETLIAPVLREKEVTIIHGSAGRGKSFFAMSLAHALATEGEFARFKAPKRSKVAYIDGELSLDQVKERFLQIDNGASSKFLGGDTLDILSSDSPDTDGSVRNLADPDHQPYYLALAEKYDVLFIDSILTCCFPLKGETEFDWWPRMTRFLKKASRKLRCSIVLVHHQNKEGSFSGSQLKKNDCDNMIGLYAPIFDAWHETTVNEFRWEKARSRAKHEQEDFFLEFGIHGHAQASQLSWAWIPQDRAQEKIYQRAIKHFKNEQKAAAALQLKLSQFQALHHETFKDESVQYFKEDDDGLPF